MCVISSWCISSGGLVLSCLFKVIMVCLHHQCLCHPYPGLPFSRFLHTGVLLWWWTLVVRRHCCQDSTSSREEYLQIVACPSHPPKLFKLHTISLPFMPTPCLKIKLKSAFCFRAVCWKWHNGSSGWCNSLFPHGRLAGYITVMWPCIKAQASPMGALVIINSLSRWQVCPCLAPGLAIFVGQGVPMFTQQCGKYELL